MNKEVLSAMEALCAKREYCVSDIRRKALLKLEGDGEAAEEIVASLVADKFVDDARYASAFAREKASLQGWGPIKIRFQLRMKGISDADISAALDDVDTEKAAARLERLLVTKWKTLREDPQGRLKLIKFALSRGYDYSEVERFLTQIVRNLN
ncbi:MAG: RecX family transcriptional regulator [Bacteroidales bacterium]|nr:RecX family transcriptional regulator [Bacteroidales bacterium]